MESSSINSPPSDLINRTKTYSNRSTKRTLVWAIILILSTVYLAASLPKLGGFGFFDARFERWGYPHWFEMVIGILEAAAAIFLILPSTTVYAAGVLGIIMLGAIFTHLFFGQAILAIIPLIMLCLVVFVGWTRRPSAVHTMIRRREVGIKKTPGE